MFPIQACLLCYDREKKSKLKIKSTIYLIEHLRFFWALNKIGLITTLQKKLINSIRDKPPS